MEAEQADPSAQIRVNTPSVSIQPVPEFNPDAEFPTYDLKAILLDGRRDEQSTFQARDIESKEKGNEELNKVNRTANTCRNCGGMYPHVGNCPAKNKQCKSCGKYNHFAKVCRGKPKKFEGPQEHQSKRRQNQFKKRIHPVAQVEHDLDSSDENYVYAMTSDKAPKAKRQGL